MHALQSKMLLTLFYLSFSGFFLGIALHQIFIGLFLLFQIYTAISNGTPIARPLYGNRIALLFLGGILVSALWTSFAYYSPFTEVSFHWAFLTFWLFDRDFMEHIDWEKFLMFFAVLALPGMVRSFFWLFQPDEFLWAMKVGFSHFPRAFGLNANPITHSEGMVVLLCWLLARISYPVASIRKKQWLLLIGTILLLITLSRVRSGWLAFMVISSMHAMLFKKHRKLIAILLSALTSGFFAAMALFGFNTASIGERMELLMRGVQLFREHPFLGIGPERFAEYAPISNGLFSHPHNTIVGMGAEMGVLGLLLFSAFFIGMLYRAFKLFMAYKGTNHPYAWVTQALFYSLISFLVFGITDYNFGCTEVLLLHGLQWALIARIPMPAVSNSLY